MAFRLPGTQRLTAVGTIAYEGPAVDAGTMDVKELAPALLSVGDLCQAANRALNEDRAEVSVHVRAFRPGSFEVALDVIQNTTIIQTLVFHEGAHSARDLLGWLGLAGGLTGVNLISLIKLLHGRKPESATTLEDGNIRLTVNIQGNVEGGSVVVSPTVMKLYDDGHVRRALAGVIKPVEHPGITRFVSKEEDRVVERVEDEDASSFFSASGDDAEHEPLIYEGETVSAWEIIKPSMRRGLTWVFAEGSVRFDAYLDDQAFLDRVDRREISFGARDILIVRALIRQTRKPDGKTRVVRRVVKVDDVKPAPRQEPLL